MSDDPRNLHEAVVLHVDALTGELLFLEEKIAAQPGHYWTGRMRDAVAFALDAIEAEFPNAFAEGAASGRERYERRARRQRAG